MIKTLNSLDIEGMFLNIIMAEYNKPIANIKLNGEKLKAFTLKSRTRQGCSLILFLFNIILEVLPIAIRQEKEINAFSSEGRIKSISIYYDLIYKNSKQSTETLLELIIEFRKIADYKINIHKSAVFLYINNGLSKREIKE